MKSGPSYAMLAGSWARGNPQFLNKINDFISTRTLVLKKKKKDDY